MINEAADQAYWERNQLVAFLTKLYPSHMARHPSHDIEWDEDWRWIACVHSPKGQLSWHIHDSELHNFAHLKVMKNDWDGHTTEEKYNRLRSILPNEKKQ